MRQQESILEYRGGVYLKLALLICAAAIAAYALHEVPAVYRKPYGGTWLGYTLGGVGAFLILWMMLLGLRKRRYGSSMGTLHGWTSSHVYIGATLLVVVTLHSGFELGWNVHTLAYALMVLVIASGVFGVYTYLHYPALITANFAGDTLESTLLKIADLDRRCRRLALDLPDDANALVLGATRSAARESKFAGSLRLRGDRVRCPTREACKKLVALGARRQELRVRGGGDAGARQYGDDSCCELHDPPERPTSFGGRPAWLTKPFHILVYEGGATAGDCS